MGGIVSSIGGALGGLAGTALGGPIGGAIGSSLGSSLIGGSGGGGGGGAQSTGGSTSGGTSTFENTTEFLVPDYLQDILPDLAGRVNELSLQPYQPFTGDRFGQFTPDQLAAFSGVRDIQGQYQPLIESARGISLDAAQGITGEDIQGFQNPYQQQVIDRIKQETLRDFDVQLEGIGDQAARAGAFGGSRQGVVESEAYRSLQDRLTNIQTAGSQQGYDRALSAAFSNTQLQQAGVGNLASLAGAGQTLGMRDLASLQQIGGQQQAFQQAGRDFDYSQFVEEQAFPYQQTEFALNSILPLFSQTKGVHSFGSGTGTQNVNQLGGTVSPISSVLGAGLGLLGSGGGGGIGSAIGGSLGGFFGGSTGGAQTLGSFFGGSQSTGQLGANAYTSPIGPTTSPNIGGFFGLKEGGLVKYAGGGQVRYDQGGPIRGYEDTRGYSHGGGIFSTAEEQFRGAGRSVKGFLDLLDEDFRTPKEPITGSRGERFLGGLGRLGETAIEFPLRAIHGADRAIRAIDSYLKTDPDISKAEKTKIKKRKKELQKTIEDVKERREIEQQLLYREKPELRPSVEPVLEGTPEEVALKTKVNAIAKEIGVTPVFGIGAPTDTTKPSPVGTILPSAALPISTQAGLAPPPRQIQGDVSRGQTGTGGPNLPLLKAAARMLASPGESVSEALGNSLNMYVDMKSGEGSAKVAAKQQAFANSLGTFNADTNRINAEIGQQKVELENRLYPLEAQLKKAQTAKAQAEANMKAAFGPNLKGLELLAQNPQFAFAGPAEQQQMLQQMMSLMQGGGGGAGADPLKGDIVDGYEFQGGDPTDKDNWKKL